MIKTYRFGEKKIESEDFWKQELRSSCILLPFLSREKVRDFCEECIILPTNNGSVVEIETSGDLIVCVKVHHHSKENRFATQKMIMELYYKDGRK